MMGSLQLLDIWLQSQKQKGSNSFFETSGSSFIWKILLTPPALKRKIQVQKEVENTLWICEFRKFSQTLPGKKKKPKLTHQWGILKYHPKSKQNQNRKLMPSRNLNPKKSQKKKFSLHHIRNAQTSTKLFLFFIAVDSMWKTLECYHLWPKVILWHSVYCFTLVCIKFCSI